MEEIKNYVKVTKSDLWKAYKEKVEELKQLKATRTPTVVETAKEEQINTAINIAENQDTDKLQSALEDLIALVSEYKEVSEALVVKKDELKKVHDIVVEADTYTALVQAKAQVTADKQLEAKEIIEKAKKEAEEIVDEATDKKDELDKQIIDAVDAFNKDAERRKEEFEYEFKRTKKEKTDKLDDELVLKKKSLDEREALIKIDEDKAKETVKEIDLLNDKIDQLNVDMDASVKKKVAIIEGQLKKNKEFELETAKTKHAAEISIKDNENVMLKAQVNELKTQVEKYQTLVESANTKVTDIATASLNATANEGTVNAVMETVGKVSQQGKK